MYVDKRLSGVHAVQTLSRLNRPFPGKEDTFVLDFVNEPEDILDGFRPYYEQTLVGEQAEPGQLYELQARLEGSQVVHRQDVEDFARVFYKPKQRQSPLDNARLNAAIDPAVSRFEALDEEAQEELRKAMVAYRNLYAFLSQIMPFQDADLEKLYSYVRFLLPKLPRPAYGPQYHFDDDVALQYYRLQKATEGRIRLEPGEQGEVSGPTDVGTGQSHAEEIELSELIDILNERFGTDFTEGDQLFFDAVRADAVENPELRKAALANTLENFGFAFKKVIENLFVERMEQNESIATRFFNDDEFRALVSQKLMEDVYNRARAGEEAPRQG
jgi:type I restriction enzyme R subunit